MVYINIFVRIWRYILVKRQLPNVGLTDRKLSLRGWRPLSRQLY